MKLPVIVAAVVASTTIARADVFAFKDRDGFERCLNTDHLIESKNTSDGAQHRFLSQVEIQIRCIESAVKLLSGTRNNDTFHDFIDSVKRLSAPENAIDLVDLDAGVSLATCNDMENYSVITKGEVIALVEANGSKLMLVHMRGIDGLEEGDVPAQQPDVRPRQRSGVQAQRRPCSRRMVRRTRRGT